MPFPHENETRANQQFFVEFSQLAMKHAFVNLIKFATLVAVPLGAIYYYVA